MTGVACDEENAYSSGTPCFASLLFSIGVYVELYFIEIFVFSRLSLDYDLFSFMFLSVLSLCTHIYLTWCEVADAHEIKDTQLMFINSSQLLKEIKTYTTSDTCICSNLKNNLRLCMRFARCESN